MSTRATTSRGSSSRQAVLAGLRRIAIVDRPVPRPGPREVVVRILAAATCGTDLKGWRRGHALFPPPSPFGHEWVGVVEEAGPGAAHAQGSRVVGLPTAPCGGCDRCNADLANLCAIERGMLVGAYADRLLVPARIADRHLFPTKLPAERAVLLEPLSCVVHALGGYPQVGSRGPRLRPGRALVLGGGPAGLLFTALLAERGADVSLWGRRVERRKMAQILGARATGGPEDSGREDWIPLHGPYDLVVETTGDLELLSLAPEWVRGGGTLISYAGPPPGSEASFDLHRLHYQGIRLIVPFHYSTASAVRAMGFLEHAPRPVEKIFTATRRLADLPAVFDDLDAGRGIKYLVVP